MRQYLDLMQDIIDNGTWQANRTGIRTKMLPGAMLKFDLRKGFPVVTTKKLAYRAVVGELLGFLRGYDNAQDFNRLGCKVWDANATAWGTDPYCDYNGHLGRIYGVQWRSWNDQCDQIATLLREICVNPTSRRLIVTAWNPSELHLMALPPCHYSFQVIIEQETRTMHLLWNQRSCDMFLGVPFNIASYATLLHILAALTGYNVGTLTGFLADVHLYENHMEQAREQLTREPLPLPQWGSTIKPTDALVDIEPSHIALVGYESHGAIAAPMAV